MVKKIILFLIISISLFPVSLYAACTDNGGGNWTCASCSIADIQDCITAASAEDTINIPAGSCTWTGQLVITSGYVFIGAGKATTVITSNYNASTPGNAFAQGNFLIVYDPTTPSNNETFRISAIGLDLADKCGGIFLDDSSVAEMTKIRIDNCSIIDATNPGGPMRGIMLRGHFWGVIDNNTISGCYKGIDSYANNATTWDNLTFSYGSANNIYYEDNTFTLADCQHSAGAGGRYCIRYNTYTSSGALYPCFDQHGNQGVGQHHATMGVEIYKNDVTLTGNHGTFIFSQRGGKGMYWDNDMTTTGSVTITVREEVDDADNPTTNPQPQHVSDSYYWNNTKNVTTLVYAAETEDCCAAIAKNSEFYNQVVGFSGTTGMGRDTLAARPATCTTGVGYWATDEDVFYKCTATNTWTLYYTPYTYPHPLRGSTSVSISNSKGGDLNESDIVGGVTVYYTITGDTFTADSVTSGNTNDFVQAGFSSNRSDPNGFVNTVKANFSNTDFVLNSGATRMAVWWADGAYDMPQTEEQVSFEIPGGALTSGVTTEAGSVSIGVEASGGGGSAGTGVGMVWSAQGREWVHDKDGVEVVR